jgi:ribosomal protein S17E
MRAVRKRTMKEIALELLAQYKAAETTIIWDFSCNIEDSEKKLEKKIAAYKAEIEEADAREKNNESR